MSVRAVRVGVGSCEEESDNKLSELCPVELDPDVCIEELEGAMTALQTLDSRVLRKRGLGGVERFGRTEQNTDCWASRSKCTKGLTIVVSISVAEICRGQTCKTLAV